jgi:hypothetical protein
VLQRVLQLIESYVTSTCERLVERQLRAAIAIRTCLRQFEIERLHLGVGSAAADADPVIIQKFDGDVRRRAGVLRSREVCGREYGNGSEDQIAGDVSSERLR